jgi:hypothetical protein
MIFTSLDAPEMQSYLDGLSSPDDPFEIAAEQEEEDGIPLAFQVVPKQNH